MDDGKFAVSLSQARRLIHSGVVTVNGTPVTSLDQEFPTHETTIMTVGKRKVEIKHDSETKS